MKLYTGVQNKLKDFGITIGDLYYRDSKYFKGNKEYLINLHKGDEVRQIIIPFAEEDKDKLDNNIYTSFTIFDNALTVFYDVGDIIENMSADRYEAIHQTEEEYQKFKQEVFERSNLNEPKH